MLLNAFDKTASAYYSSTPAIPQTYIRLLQDTFQITPQDRIIDLGCGSGDLALTFANTSPFVEGLDSSRSMIAMAKQKDRKQQVTWIRKSVADLDFGVERYRLILSFEAWHLFPNHQALIQKCARALKAGGFLGLGWAMYEWDVPLRDAITETFAAYGICRGEWGLWTCPHFAEDVAAVHTCLAAPQRRLVRIRTETPIDVIVDYVFSNSRSAFLRLSEASKQAIVKDLHQRFLQIYPSGKSKGYTTYSLVYSQRVGACE